MDHFSYFQKELTNQFEFDFLGHLYALDTQMGTDYLDMNQDSLEFFIKNKTSNMYLDYLKEDDNGYKAWINMVLSTYHYYKHHQKRFQLTPDITNMLLQTDMKDVHVAFVKLPFPSIYLELPKGMLKGETNGQEYEVEGVYVHQYNLKPIDKKTIERHLGKGIVSYLQLGIVLKNNEEYQYGIVHLRFKNGNVVEQLQENYKRASLQFEEIANDIFSLVLNTLFYIQSDKSDMEYIEERPLILLNKPENHIPKKGHYKVGRKVIINSSLKKKLKQYEKSPLKAEQNYKWLVRGHWRNQPIGKGRKERKMIWIEPYLKGNTEDDLIHREYEVKK